MTHRHRATVPVLLIALLGTAGASTPAYADFSVAMGNSHALALKDDGTVWAWGYNFYGQVGDGTLSNRPTPVAVSSLSSVTRIAAGGTFSLALKADGTVWAWGNNGNGQLGDGTTTTRWSPVQVSGLTNISAIAAGDTHALALKSDGTLWAWGYNAYGQVGDGTQTQRTTPVQVSSLSIYVVAIAAHANASLAVKTDGTVWGWGDNSYGTVGNGTTTTPKLTPTQTSSLNTMTAVSSGSTSSFAWDSSGSLRAWGYNSQSELGDGTTTWRTSPVQITGISSVATLRGGTNHTVASKVDGTVWAWGYNYYGQVGDGTSTARLSPVSIAGPDSVVMVSARGNSSIAVSSDGRIWTWGANPNSVLGDGTTETRRAPVQISDAGFAWRVATPGFNYTEGSYQSTLNVTVSDATAGATIHYTTNGVDPTESDPVIASGSAVSITQTTTLKARAWKTGMPASNIASATYTLVVPSVGYSLGSGTYTTAQTLTLSLSLANSSIRYTTDGSTPTASSPLYTAPLSITTGMTLKAAGFRTGWTSSAVTSLTYFFNYGTLAAPAFTPTPGEYGYGQLVSMSALSGATIRYTTDGSTPNTSSPLFTSAIPLTGTVTFRAKAYHPDWTSSGVAVGVYTVKVAAPTFSPSGGSYAPGQLITISNVTPSSVIRYTTNGLDPTDTDPVIASGGTIVAGNFTLKARAFRTGWTQSDVTSAAYALTAPATPPGASAGSAHSILVRDDGTVWTWGMNSSGQLGDGSQTSRSVPGIVNGVSGVVAVAAGGNHSLALTSAGMVLAWGNNGSGQLGDGTTTNRLVPIGLPSLTDVIAIAAGTNFSIALKSNGTVWTWGLNGRGQLGDGTTTQRTVPVQVSGLTSIVDIAAGDSHVVAHKSDGTIWAWGQNLEGELGDGTTTDRLSPVQASFASASTPIVSAGDLQSYVVLGDGSVWSWGGNPLGTLGLGFDNGVVSTPTQIPSFGSVVRLDGGGSHTLAIKTDGTVWAWGNNAFGQLGEGTPNRRNTPSQVTTVSNAVIVSGGGAHSLAITSDGTVWAWGRNDAGQLGDGTLSDRGFPVKISEAGFAWKTSTPRLNPATGSYSSITNVTVTAMTPGAVIHYTTNGVDPTASDPVVASGSAVTIDDSVTLKATAWAGSMPASNVASAVYTMNLPLPGFSPAPGAYSATQSVTLTSSVPGVTIRYTTDGTTPTGSSPIATGPIAVNDSTTILARSYRSGWTDSGVATGVFTLKAVVPSLSPTGGAYGSAQSVTISTTTAGASITYTTDGSEPLITSTPYTGPVSVTSTTTLKAKAWRTGWSGSNSGVGSFWITEGVVATPTMSPNGGSFTTATWVSLATATAGSTIRYTVDGSDPTGSSPAYVSPIRVDATTSIKARAFKPGYTASAAATATFAVDAADAVATPSISPAGSWTTTQQIATIGVSTSGATIHYTTNGTDPAETDPVVASGGTITVDRSMVLKAKAWKTGLQPSAVRRADFVVTGALATGWFSSYALLADGTMRSWGANNYGQLGDGTWMTSLVPVSIPGLTGVVAIASGEYHALAAKADGTVWSWGANAYGQLGNGTTTSSGTPVQVPGLTHVVAVAAGATHSLALKDDGTVWAWGSNAYGQIGDGTTTSRLSPVIVPGLTGVVRIETGDNHSLAIETDGTRDGIVWAWGANDSGQLGDGSTLQKNAPVRVATLAGIRSIAGGLDFSYALASDGTLWSWGRNESGQLADATTVARSNAVRVPGLANVTLASAGRFHGVAIDADGQAWSWGANTSSQHGDGPTPDRAYAALLPSFGGALTMASSWTHTLVVKPNGGVWAWGANAGAIGDGTTPTRSTPVSVSGLSIADNSWLIGDPDDDGLPTWREYFAGTDPLNWDTSGSGLGDRVLVETTFNPANTDLDGDGVPNSVEAARGTDALKADTDGDGVADGADAFPLDPSRSQAPAADPNDHTPPVITLTEPTNAVPLP